MSAEIEMSRVSKTKEKRGSDDATELSPKRFTTLFTFSLCSLTSALFFAEYTIIHDIIVTYFKVSSMEVTATSMIFTLGFALSLPPSLVILEKKGCRTLFVVGMTMVAVGAWIRCGAALGPDYFWTLLLGHAFVGMAQCAFFPMTTLYVAKWFPAEEVSRACSVGIFGNVLGIALGCLLPPLIVNGRSMEEIWSQLLYLNLSFALASTVAWLSAVFILQDEPPKPPSLSQKILRDTRSLNVTGGSSSGELSHILKIIKKKNCLLLIIPSSINFGVMNTIAPIMNELILQFYPGANKDVGILATLIPLIGIPTSMIYGSLMDKTRKYKVLYISSSIGCCFGLVFFAGSLYYNMIMIYVAMTMLGFFLSACLSVSFQFGAEISYPLSEIASSGLIVAGGGIIGLIMTFSSSYMLHNYGVIAAFIIMLISCIIGSFLSFAVKSDLKRFEANIPVANG